MDKPRDANVAIQSTSVSNFSAYHYDHLFCTRNNIDDCVSKVFVHVARECKKLKDYNHLHQHQLKSKHMYDDCLVMSTLLDASIVGALLLLAVLFVLLITCCARINAG
jgi:hypothetical protein